MKASTKKRRKEGVVTNATLERTWKRLVKDRDENKCVLCGSTELLNAHHLVSVDNKNTRWDLANGISLCPSHHKFNNMFSAHKNPRRFYEWFAINRPEQNEYLKTVEDKEFDGDWNEVYRKMIE